MINSRHTIEFGPKFCQAQFDFVVRENIQYVDIENNIQTSSHWHRSFSPDTVEVVFDLIITEWINTEEVVFLFAWMYKLINANKQIKIILPWSNATIKLASILPESRMKYLTSKYNLQFYDDNIEAHIAYNKERDRKRKNLNVSLMTNWDLLNNIYIKKITIENKLTDSSYNKAIEHKYYNNTNKVIPFTVIQSNVNGNVLNFEDVFDETITKQKLLEVEEDYVSILSQHGCYSIFESKVLINVIFQELFFNTIQHAFDDNMTKECFTGASFKQESLHTANEDFKIEKESEMLDFFKNKVAIRHKLVERARDIKTEGALKNRPRNKANLEQYDDLNPMSYIKYTFLDFGKGYSSTLKGKFDETKDSMRHLFSKDFEKANRDSQIIEYAFLLETSCNPIDKNMEYYKFVPRGLFFLIDMVRRNKGLLKIRSGKGKVFYDFSDKIYGEVRNEESKINIHNPYNISDAVIHSSEKQIPNFEGTMISILLPGKESKEYPEKHESTDTRVLSPVRLENEILNNYVYYKNNDQEKRNVYSVEQMTETSYEFISMIYVFHNAIKEFNESSKSSPKEEQSIFKKRSFYNYSFSALTKEIDRYTGKNCVIFFDFAELHYTSQVLKVIYYLLETPKINEVTKAVIINLDKVSDSIITEINTKLNDENLGPKLFKPIPCLSFSDREGEPIVKWIGLKNEADADIMTKILIGNDLHDRERRAENIKVPEDLEGNIFIEFENRIYSFF